MVPIYIPSKGRHESRLTVKALLRMGLEKKFKVIVEEQQFNDYVSVIDRSNLLVLDKAYQRDYDTCDNIGDSFSKGSGPARNFAWDHAKAYGHAWHWTIDDNIRTFYRLHENRRIQVLSPEFFTPMEDFVERYTNVVMAGPQYKSFAPAKTKWKPLYVNRRLFSCNLIKTSSPFRWRARYNEDVDLSLRMLKAGFCTVMFYAFLQDKMRTQTMKGGNTDELYQKGTLAKSQMIVRLHPDVCKLIKRYGRWHHSADFSGFTQKLIRKPDAKPPGNYPLTLTSLTEG